MKLKSILLIPLATLTITASMAQNVPAYVPTNALSSYWPFSGNANDLSINAKNGIVQNAVLTTDRFGNANSAYYFNGTNSYIQVPDNNDSILDLTQNFTISTWASIDQLIGGGPTMLSKHIGNLDNMGSYEFIIGYHTPVSQYKLVFFATPNYNDIAYSSFNSFPSNIWVNYVLTYDFLSQNCIYYANGTPVDTVNINYDINNTTIDFLIGCTFLNNTSNYDYYFKGKLDDIGIWKRTLTQQEIIALYNASTCANNTAITPQTNSLSTGSTATFTASTSDPNPSYVWQSDLGQDFQTLNNFGNYLGANTAILNIANMQLANHNQSIRVISTSGNCIDTSDVAIINILDTCITNVTVYDTLLTTVTDTLIINATITGLNPPSNQNTIKVFPNPANTHITVDYGNFTSMNGYTLTIVNSIGQTVFTTAINQQTSYLDLSTWTGTGIYYVQLIDTQNNTIENRKIVIQ